MLSAYGSNLLWPFALERHGTTERRFTTPELPGKHAEDQALVLQLLGLDVAAEVLDVHAVEGEERIVRELVGRIREHLLHAFGSAEQLLGLRAHLVAVPLHAFPEEAPDGQVHRVV